MFYLGRFSSEILFFIIIYVIIVYDCRYVFEYLFRICRVLRILGGNVLLVGVGGSGR